jgi:hypothetical protein
MSHSHNTNGSTFGIRRHAGFTFMEILVALCIVLIALVPLIHLHVVSIHMIDAGSHMAKATLVANDRLAEILARDVPELGKSSGQIEDATSTTVYRWTVVITDAAVPELESTRLMGIRQVHVDVAWQDGERDVVVSLDTLVHVAPQSKRQILDNANDEKSNEQTPLPQSGM